MTSVQPLFLIGPWLLGSYCRESADPTLFVIFAGSSSGLTSSISATNISDKVVVDDGDDGVSMQ